MGVYSQDYIDIDSVRAITDNPYQVIDDQTLSANRQVLNGFLCKDILKFLNEISSLKKAPFLESDVQNRHGEYHLTKEGLALDNFAKRVYDLGDARECYKLHPKIELFYRFVMERDICVLMHNNRALLFMSWANFHSKLKSKAMAVAVRNFVKGPEENYKSLVFYIEHLFGLYARLLVIRVDLAYKAEDGNVVSLEEVVKHRETLLSTARKDSLAKHWVGYAWRLEYAPKTGYHYHLVVFLDGSKYNSEYTHSENIRQAWRTITEERGRAYLCNHNTKQYRFIGIGMVNYHDETKREYLRKALAYLTKADKIVKLSLPNHRTFGKGCVKRRNTNKGRKRSKLKAL